MSLTRKGVTTNNTIDDIDDLQYDYFDDSNQLNWVNDAAGDNGFKDDDQSGNDYQYDANGNMTADMNKGIINIEYNHLNLPKKVEFATNSMTGKYIEYIYDATGVKLEKRVQEENLSSVSYTYYQGNYIYEKSTFTSPLTLKFISQPEGYIEPDNQGGFDYIFQYKDHLGNIRLSYKDSNNDGSVDSSEIIEEINYYPFGLKHKGYNNVINGQHYPYGYNGKEENDELGLEWLDFGARNYDAALGRWMNLDPLAEEMRRHSPYNYAFDNPVYFIDPDGRKPEASQTADVYYDWDEGGYRTQEGDDEGGDDCCPDGEEPSEVSSLKNYLSNNSVLNALNSLFGGDGESSSDWSFLDLGDLDIDSFFNLEDGGGGFVFMTQGNMTKEGLVPPRKAKRGQSVEYVDASGFQAIGASMGPNPRNKIVKGGGLLMKAIMQHNDMNNNKFSNDGNYIIRTTYDFPDNGNSTTVRTRDTVKGYQVNHYMDSLMRKTTIDFNNYTDNIRFKNFKIKKIDQ